MARKRRGVEGALLDLLKAEGVPHGEPERTGGGHLRIMVGDAGGRFPVFCSFSQSDHRAGQRAVSWLRRELRSRGLVQ